MGSESHQPLESVRPGSGCHDHDGHLGVLPLGKSDLVLGTDGLPEKGLGQLNSTCPLRAPKVMRHLSACHSAFPPHHTLIGVDSAWAIAMFPRSRQGLPP